MTTPSNPTIVLVHGAWADSSSWSPVIDRLRDARYPVRAIANPLQGLTSDTAHATSYLDTIDGPKVLVGHSYGGAIITNAATAVPEVKSLVYIAGFIPAKGETIGELAAKSTPALPLVSTQVPDGTEVIIDPAQFREAFAGDLDPTTAADLAITQRPANTKAVTDASAVWRVTSPSPRGTSSPPRTTPSTRTCSASWPPAPRHASPRSPPRTQSCSAIPTP